MYKQKVLKVSVWGFYNLRFLSELCSSSVRRFEPDFVEEGAGFFLTTTPFSKDLISFLPDFGGGRLGAAGSAFGFESDGSEDSFGSAAATSAAYFFARALWRVSR